VLAGVSGALGGAIRVFQTPRPRSPTAAAVLCALVVRCGAQDAASVRGRLSSDVADDASSFRHALITLTAHILVTRGACCIATLPLLTA